MSNNTKIFISFILIIFGGFFLGASMTRAQESVVCAFYNETQDMNAVFGRVSPNPQKAAQPFTVAETCTVLEIGVTMYTTGTPTDDVEIEIRDDNSGTPGTLLEQCTDVSPTGTTPTEYISTCVGDAVLEPLAVYWLTVERSGAEDDTNYYRWGTGTTAPKYSELERLINGSWTPIGDGQNGLFYVSGETTADVAFDLTAIEIQLANLVYFTGLLLFLFGFWLIIWMFKGRH